MKTPIPQEIRAEHSGSAPEQRPRTGKRPHLRFLDGIRGLAALYVALFHATSFEGGDTLSPALRAVADFFRFGHLAVGVFIVLSGFCLMLPVVLAGGSAPRNFPEYLRRRAWRILPPYYAAFALSVACLTAGLAFRQTGVVVGEELRNGLSPGTIVSHLLLLHNLRFDWAHSINAPLWTVATEWQIYFLFPLVLLPVWKRFGRLAVVGLGLGLGLSPLLLLPPAHNLSWAGPWYLGLFALGMVTADYSLGSEDARGSKPLPAQVGFLSLALLAVLCLLPPFAVPLWLPDVILGLTTASLIAFCTMGARSDSGEKGPLLLKMLQSRPVAGLGAFSYSLYLIHHPLQRGILRVLQTCNLSADLTLCTQLFVSMPLIIGLAYLFHRAFELPFISRNQRTAEKRPVPKSLALGARD